MRLLARIVIRASCEEHARVTIHTARPGVVIGKKGEDVEKLRQLEVDTADAGVPVSNQHRRSTQA